MATMCEKCLHYGVCSIRDCYDADDELALVYCADYISNEGVVLKAECGAECPTCHGTGKIGTTDWLTKHLIKEQLAEEKEKANKEAIEELERKAKQEVAREIFEELTQEIKLALDSNHKARQEHIDKYFKGTSYVYDNFISLVDGKISALRGIDDFVKEAEKKYIGE